LDAARIFLEGCDAAASVGRQRLRLSIKSSAAALTSSERQIGSTLFTRDVHGTRWTTKARWWWSASSAWKPRL